MTQSTSSFLLSEHYRPNASAVLRGGTSYPDIYGIANFFENPFTKGLIIEIEIENLPSLTPDCPHFLGMHLHEKGDCSDHFSNTGLHYNPYHQKHPCHTGDFPSLLNNEGYAYLCFYDSFLTLEEVLDRSIIIHVNRDDFTSQPAGDSGEKIACGVVQTSSKNFPL